MARDMMLTVEEYMALRRLIDSERESEGATLAAGDPAPPLTLRRERRATRRKVSAYNRKYRAAFKKVSGRYKLKSGKWKKNGFRAAVKAAHKMAGGKK